MSVATAVASSANASRIQCPGEWADRAVEDYRKRQSAKVPVPPVPAREGFGVGDKVSKVGGDYRFDGVIVSVFSKVGGQVRFVVEDDRGILHIYSEKNLQRQIP